MSCGISGWPIEKKRKLNQASEASDTFSIYLQDKEFHIESYPDMYILWNPQKQLKSTHTKNSYCLASYIADYWEMNGNNLITIKNKNTTVTLDGEESVSRFDITEKIFKYILWIDWVDKLVQHGVKVNGYNPEFLH